MATNPVRQTSSAGVRRLGRYTLRYRIAQGGMASVYLAQLSGSAGFEKWIAIKTIHPHIATSNRFVNMFLDEARLASQLDHPNLCTVFDFGEDRGTWFIAMEYLHGETFGVVARTGWSNRQPPPYPMVARILADAARGLHAAHEMRLPSGEHAGVVHRDVSPENIFVTYAGPTKIVDFGVARWKSQSQDRTVAGELKGKIAYMCPEQLREELVDRRADIWSLGVVLWEVTVGRRLFRRKTDAGTVYAVLNDRVPRPTRFRPEYPEELIAIVMKALERDRDKRYQTALEFARALEQWLATTGKPAGIGEVGEYMHSLFAEQIAFRERLLRTTHIEGPLEEVSEIWRSAPIDPVEVEVSPADLVPDARPRSAADISEEATVLNADGYIRRSLVPPPATTPPPRSAPPASAPPSRSGPPRSTSPVRSAPPRSAPPASAPPRSGPPASSVRPASTPVSGPPIPLTTVRNTGPFLLGAPTSASHRAYQTALLPAWRRRGIPSLLGGGLLILVSLGVIAYFLHHEAPDPSIASPHPVPPPVVNVPLQAATPPVVAPPPSLPVLPPIVRVPAPPVVPRAPVPHAVVHPVAPLPRRHVDAADAAAPEITAASPPGYLTFIATPDAEVFEGTHSLGRTPMTDRSVSAGHHAFRFVPAEGLASQTVQVNVQPGGSSVVEMRWTPTGQ